MELSVLAHKLEACDLGSVSGLSFESCLFLLEQHVGPACVVADSFFIERTSVLFQERIGKDVACIFSSQKGIIETIDQRCFTSSISNQMLATNPNKARLMFVEKGLLEKPLIPIEQKKPFKVTRETSFEGLLSALSVLGFSQEQEFLFPGSFIIKGGVVDIFLFNINKIYRISFLESFCRVFTVNKQSNKIIKSVDFLMVFSQAAGKKVSIKQSLLPGCALYCYNQGVLKKEEGKNIADFNIRCEPVDYQWFLKNKNFKSVVFLNTLYEKGFIYKKDVFVPVWFQKQDSSIAIQAPPVDDFGLLEVGSTYIHDDFGFCSFLGLESVEKGERVCLRFVDGVVKLDINYLSKLSFVSKETKKLSFLNKPAAWNRKKALIEKRALEFVSSLVTSYTKREASSSSVLNIKDDIISSFVRAFPYKETPDQSLCWKNILKDLGSASPMNRLICGDVGFGKTELAVRATFVSIVNEQQVVLVAPTTILANQLYHCFAARLMAFGVRVGCLSRIANNKQKTVDKFLDKQIDVLVGTSSILFKKDILKQCGLFIVDEEHRFGVGNKEKVFQYNPGVNFLSLSATPIPRSMQLSLSGVRNLSLIQTPPIARKPIISSLGYFSENLIKDIIIKETSRGGQVYFVDNSVQNLKKIFKKLSVLLPFLSLDIIYGALNGNTLISSMENFVKGNTQVLLSTSIIESGIDIGSTNTIIINNAHLFGLSQLYQLRGRVGRSSVQAFAWFLFSKKTPITKDGMARLKTIVKHSALGAGYQVALSDLEIRGAGSLFGYNQSGGGSVGFEYYSKILSSVSHKTNKAKPKECFVDLLHPSIPASFLSSEQDRIFYYKKIFSCISIEELKEVKQEIIALFGVCIQEVQLLFQNKTLALLGAEKNIKRISKSNNIVSVSFAIQKTDPLIDNAVGFVVSFFTKKDLDFWFLKSHKNLIFQYKSLEKDDYILLSSFIKKITFF